MPRYPSEQARVKTPRVRTRPCALADSRSTSSRFQTLPIRRIVHLPTQLAVRLFAARIGKELSKTFAATLQSTRFDGAGFPLRRPLSHGHSQLRAVVSDVPLDRSDGRPTAPSNLKDRRRPMNRYCRRHHDCSPWTGRPRIRHRAATLACLVLRFPLRASLPQVCTQIPTDHSAEELFRADLGQLADSNPHPGKGIGVV